MSIKADCKAFQSSVRRNDLAVHYKHNGRRWSVSRAGWVRLDDNGACDPVGEAALILEMAADCRRRLGLKRATRELIALARSKRLATA